MTRTQRLACFAGAGALAIGTIVLRASAQDELDSLTICRDTQKLMFENTLVRVIDDVIPPGVSEARHHHPRGLVITLADADVETKTGAGSPARGHSTAGSVRWNEPLTHEVRNVGTAATHYIRIDIK
jgi:hypothetical protein